MPKPRPTQQITMLEQSPPVQTALVGPSKTHNHNTFQKTRQEYIKSLHVPSRETMTRIDMIQVHKEEDALKQRLDVDEEKILKEQEGKAATLIQRSYRGYRDRRMLEGLTLDPGMRWLEALKEAEWRTAMDVRRGLRDADGVEVNDRANGEGNERRRSRASKKWRRAGLIARKAGADGAPDKDESEEDGLVEDERNARRDRRLKERAKRQEAAKTMDLQYFLEVVDSKHRYASNLRSYHAEWKKADTRENFFYWLDYGAGKHIEVSGVPRERLEKERVRYLSKEERLNYLVKIDHDGRLCWAKNGARIDTTTRYKDSIYGIVPCDHKILPSSAMRVEANHHSSSDTEESEQDATDDEAARAQKYANPEFDKSKGIKKLTHLSTATIFNKLLRKSVKTNTWIFVADINFRLYVGIKQSGTFQHSSFLSAGRIADAGLIKIKEGRLSKLSPLSGHYRPPVSNFRSFVHSLKDEGVDMSHVSISRSYAVLIGLEAYVKTRKRGKRLVKGFVDHKDKIFSPEELANRQEAERDKSQSAQREGKS